MLLLEDVRDYISGLGIAADEHTYIGKLDNKSDKSIGVYHLKRAMPNKIALGRKGSYDVKNISILVHWNKSPRETERAALELFDKLQTAKDVKVNNKKIKFINLLTSEPQDVGTDDNGTYEMVIEAGFIYERQVE